MGPGVAVVEYKEAASPAMVRGEAGRDLMSHGRLWIDAATIDVDEVRRARAQLKAGILMAREGPSARCEQLAQQLLVYGRPLPTDEVIARVEAVDAAQVAAVARRLHAGPLTLTALGPIGRLEPYGKTADRLD